MDVNNTHTIIINWNGLLCSSVKDVGGWGLWMMMMCVREVRHLDDVSSRMNDYTTTYENNVSY